MLEITLYSFLNAFYATAQSLRPVFHFIFKPNYAEPDCAFCYSDYADCNNYSGDGCEIFGVYQQEDTASLTQSNHNPSNGSNVLDANPTITFTLNENGDCRAGTTEKDMMICLTMLIAMATPPLQ